MKNRVMTTRDEILSRVLLMQLQKYLPEAVEVRAYSGQGGAEAEGIVVSAKTRRNGMDYFSWDYFKGDFSAEDFSGTVKDEIKTTNETMARAELEENTTIHQLDGKWIFDYGYEAKIPSKELDGLLELISRKTKSPREAVKILSKEDLKSSLEKRKEMELEHLMEG